MTGGAAQRDILVDGPWRHREIRVGGIRFHVATGLSFAPDRPLVLLLHGFGEFWWAWRHQIPALDDAGWGVAALDLRGYGATDKTPRGYDLATTASDVAGVVHGLGYHRVVLGGHDWGGVAAWAVAATAPQQVRGLVAVSAPHPLAYPWRSDVLHRGYRQLPGLAERRMMSGGDYLPRLLRQRAGPGGFPSVAEADRYRAALGEWPNPQRALAHERTFLRLGLSRRGRAFRRELRQPVRAPLLSVRGELDSWVTASTMTTATRYVSGRSALVGLPGVGHFPHEEDPTAFNRVLIGWLAGAVVD